MKKTLILGLMTLLLSGTVRAQWIVSDPENTYQVFFLYSSSRTPSPRSGNRRKYWMKAWIT